MLLFGCLFIVFMLERKCNLCVLINLNFKLLESLVIVCFYYVVEVFKCFVNGKCYVFKIKRKIFLIILNN